MFAHLLFLFLNLLTVGQTCINISKEDPATEFYEIFIISSQMLILIYIILLWKTILQVVPLVKTCISEILRGGSHRRRSNWPARPQVELLSLNIMGMQGHRGITPEIREKLKALVKPLENRKGEGASTEFDCVICIQEVSEGEPVLTFPCSHFYHEACIWPWLNNNSTCPTCRKDLEAVV